MCVYMYIYVYMCMCLQNDRQTNMWLDRRIERNTEIQREADVYTYKEKKLYIQVYMCVSVCV